MVSHVMPAVAVLDTGNPDSDDESRKADKLAARAARFSNKLPGNRYKQVSEHLASSQLKSDIVARGEAGAGAKGLRGSGSPQDGQDRAR